MDKTEREREIEPGVIVKNAPMYMAFGFLGIAVSSKVSYIGTGSMQAAAQAAYHERLIN